MQHTVSRLPEYSRASLRSYLHSHGVRASNSEIQVIADTEEQLDAVVYVATAATDYDTREFTTVCRVLVVSIEHLADGHWLNVSSYVEDECPAQATCPPNILAQLGEARTVDAQTWRARCQHFLRSFAPSVVLTPSPLFS